MEELDGHAATMAWDWEADNIDADEDDGKPWVPVTPQTMRTAKAPRPGRAGPCHDPFPELSPFSHPHLISSGFTPLSPPRDPQAMLISSDHTQPGPVGLSQSHPKSWPEPWSECTPTAFGMWMPSKITWPSCDDHTSSSPPRTPMLIGSDHT